MSTATEDRKPDQSILGTAEACDGLNAVIHKLRAVEAAARGTDIGPESEGLSRIVGDLWREVEEIHDLVRGVNAHLRENGRDGTEQHERGVYSQAYRADSGDEVLLAIDSGGRRVASATVRPHADRYQVRDHLRAILDHLDPGEVAS